MLLEAVKQDGRQKDDALKQEGVQVELFAVFILEDEEYLEGQHQKIFDGK